MDTKVRLGFAHHEDHENPRGNDLFDCREGR